MISTCKSNCVHFTEELKYTLQHGGVPSGVVPDAPNIGTTLLEGANLCACQYCYWHENPSPSSPHNTDLTEDFVRKFRPDIAQKADSYEKVF
jgi:hypothetical protein